MEWKRGRVVLLAGGRFAWQQQRNADLPSTDDTAVTAFGGLVVPLAAGFELHLDRVEVTLPQGTMRTRLDVEVAESDIDDFTWTSALLALDASLDLSVPVDLVEVATAADPQLNAAIAMGFLKRNGDVYEMEAAFKKGLLTVNGAPMPIPIPGLQ